MRTVVRRVLWVAKGLGPGGAETLLAAAARAHDAERFEIECAYVLPWKDHLVGRLESAGVRTRCLSLRRTDRRWPWRLFRLVRDGGYDVVHVHSPLPGSVARLAVRSLPSGRRPVLIATEHNRWETHRGLTRLAERLTSPLDDETFAVSEEVRDSLAGPVAKRAVVLRHGIDVPTVRSAIASRSRIRDELGLARDELVVGTVANFRPQKDYPNLLAAVGRLADRGVSLRVVAVGQGPQEDEVRRSVVRLGLSDRVVLTGFRDDAVEVMGACDAFVLASAWEGLPVAVMEALALGLPIVATAVGGVGEVLDDGTDALLVPPGDPEALADALESVASSAELRARLGAAALARASEFDIGRAVDVIERAYERAAPAQPAPAQPVPARTRPGRQAGLDIREVRPDDREEVIALLRQSLGSDGDARYAALFAWKHDENRFGESPMWVATDGGDIVAFRTLMRWEFLRNGEIIRAVRAVDTATRPDHQGRGLFRALTLHGLDQVRADGVAFVFNTPNDQSMPGYLRMGWRTVGRLPAAVRFGGVGGALAALRSRVPADRWSHELEIGEPFLDWLDRRGPDGRSPVPRDVREVRTSVDDAFLAWRYGTPLLGYRVVDDGDAAVVVRARRRGRASELAVVTSFGPRRAVDRLAGRAACDADADYAIRLGEPQMSSGFSRLPGGGPVLTWRAVADAGPIPLSNWALELGDIELF